MSKFATKENLNSMYQKILPYLGDNSESSDYSTSEKIVGTWIDGKPVYQRTFTGNLLNIYDADQTIVLISQGINKVIQANGYASNNTGVSAHIPFSPGREANAFFEVWIVSGALQFLYRNRWAHTNYAITVQYTKTTD